VKGTGVELRQRVMFIYLNETAVFVLFLIHPKAIQWKNFSNVD
jgi:hypothetical protein